MDAGILFCCCDDYIGSCDCQEFCGRPKRKVSDFSFDRPNVRTRVVEWSCTQIPINYGYAAHDISSHLSRSTGSRAKRDTEYFCGRTACNVSIGGRSSLE